MENLQEVSVLAVGDMIVGGQSPHELFFSVSPVLRSADLVIGQLEAPFTSRSVEKYYVEIPYEIFATEACDPKNIATLARAGFHVLTLAGNHIWDSGVAGIKDTIDGLKKNGIIGIGAGMNIDEAKRPAILERKGVTFGILSYNCVGPKISWATPEKPGCAYVHVVTAYELEHPTPGGTPTIYTFATLHSIKSMQEDIERLRPQCSMLIVCLHKGIGFVEARIADYERQISYAAIDAGADAIMGHHAHILRGIEFYKGRPIFHGLGNFVISKPPKKEGPRFAIENFVRKSRELLGPFVVSNPSLAPYPYHEETMKTIIAKLIVREQKVWKVKCIPCLLDRNGAPEVLKADKKGEEILSYLRKITEDASLNGKYEWDGDEIHVFC